MRVAMPAVLVTVMVGGAAFGADGEHKDHKDLAGPRAHPPATQPGEPGFDGRPRRGQDMMQLLGALNLSDDQKTQVRDIQADFRQRMEAFRKDHGEEMKQLREEAQAARKAKDMAKGKEVGDKIRKLLEDNHLNLKDHLAKIRGVLNDEQKKIFDEKLKERMENSRPGMGGHANRRGERRRDRGEKDGATTRPAEEKKQLDI
jgi:Spy/CpxP family protein refolding chaperone